MANSTDSKFSNRIITYNVNGPDLSSDEMKEIELQLGGTNSGITWNIHKLAKQCLLGLGSKGQPLKPKHSHISKKIIVLQWIEAQDVKGNDIVENSITVQNGKKHGNEFHLQTDDFPGKVSHYVWNQDVIHQVIKDDFGYLKTKKTSSYKL